MWGLADVVLTIPKRDPAGSLYRSILPSVLAQQGIYCSDYEGPYLVHQWFERRDCAVSSEGLIPFFLPNLQLMIPSPEHMKQLYAACKVKRKIWKEMPNGSHNDTVAELYFFNHIFDFVSEELGA